MFLSEMFFSEARRNPEQNPRIGMKEALAPYKNNPNIFISFVDDVGVTSAQAGERAWDAPEGRPLKNVSGFKIGINPKSSFTTTPVGIYAFPLRECWDALWKGILPFSYRTAIYVLRSDERMVDLDTYDRASLERDADKLLRMTSDESTRNLIKMRVVNTKHPGREFWDLTGIVAQQIANERHGSLGQGHANWKSEKGRPVVWNGVLRALGYGGVVDRKGQGIIHRSEPTQGVFLHGNAFTVMDLLRNDLIKEGETLEEERLDEVGFIERSRMKEVLDKHAGRFIHFSRVQKLGVNPHKSHLDPHGIYFYPVDWINAERNKYHIHTGGQYGFQMPYYFIADVDLSGPGFVLSKMTFDDISDLAERNGWRHLLDDFQDVEALRQNRTLPYYANLDHPGSFFWHVVDYLQKNKKITWSKALRGLGYIYDDGNAIIHIREPMQLLVLDPRRIKIVDVGVNKLADKLDDFNKTKNLLLGLRRVFDAVVEQVGGQIAYKNKMISYVWSEGDRRVEVTTSEPEKDIALYLDYAYGRARGHVSIPKSEIVGGGRISGDYKATDAKSVAAKIIEVIEQVRSAENDLLFKPVVSISDAEQIIKKMYAADGLEFTFETEINNEDIGSRTYTTPRLVVTGTATRNVDGIPLRTVVDFHMSAEHFRTSIDVFGPGRYPIAEASDYLSRDISRLADDPKIMAEKLRMYIEERDGLFGPKVFTYRSGGRNPDAIRDPGDWNAFLGWFALNCGLSMQGHLAKEMAKYIAAYEAHDDKDYLHRQIALALESYGK